MKQQYHTPDTRKRTGCTRLLLRLCLLAAVALQAAGCGGQEHEQEKGVKPTAVRCTPGSPVETDGRRLLALVVGVGEYQNETVPDLRGPQNDARRFYELLTGENGYGFPEANVCLLLDEAATTSAFKELFETALVAQARKDDVAVVFFAGHGSQARDKNRDEPDEWDETMMFSDARTQGVSDLVDDEFNQMLARLHEKTRNITVVFDSCNSGTATRRPAASTTAARFFSPMPAGGDETNAAAGVDPGGEATQDADAAGDSGAGWIAASFPGIVVFSAAADSTPALEKNGKGIFTDALVRVLADASDAPRTYGQIARQVPPLVAAQSPQVPYFHGDLSRTVFGTDTRTRPVAWEVIQPGPPLKLGGPALPGIGKGAEFRIYDGAVTGADTRDPGKAKATVVLTQESGLTGTATISASRENPPEIAPGDLAVMVRPSDDYIALKVRIRPEEEAGGLSRQRAAKIRKQVEEDPETGGSANLVEGPGDFELSVGFEDRLVLRGPENRIRNTYASDAPVSESLAQHARQRALLALRGDGGSDFTDNRTLQVSLVEAPASRQSRCARGEWQQAEPNTLQVVPLCHAWNVQVALSNDAPMPLLVGALLLSTDGGMLALPRDGRKVRLLPGKKTVFNGPEETFMGTPPLEVQDRILVFGTQETNPVDWSQFARPAASRSPGASALAQALHRYLQAGRRGIQTVDEGPVEETTWTLSSLAVRVEANPRFLNAADPDGGADGDTRGAFDWREYTLSRFDIRPYLPDDTTVALYRVLTLADRLAEASAADGYGYRQHAWELDTDEANLKRGIDCSRAIWFVFTRSGLTYNREDRYLSTAMMVGEDTRMQDAFEQCDPDQPLATGDILVYRDEVRGDGHVVMVIDPEKRIAWGSHGWDGNPGVLPVEPDTGVEYQKIKYKQDWERWDRKTMKRKACWRHRRFAEQAAAGRGLPGLEALKNICNERLGCGG